MSKSTELLKVKKVIVIGGSSGHGRLLDAATLAHSASVVISSSSQEKVDIAIDRLKQGVSPISNVTLIGQAVITTGDIPTNFNFPEQGIDTETDVKGYFEYVERFD